MNQREAVDTTVITYTERDYGQGPIDRVIFQDCKFKVDNGTLIVYLAQDDAKIGNVATFAPGEWASVIRGHVVALADSSTNSANVGVLKVVTP